MLLKSRNPSRARGNMKEGENMGEREGDMSVGIVGGSASRCEVPLRRDGSGGREEGCRGGGGIPPSPSLDDAAITTALTFHNDRKRKNGETRVR